MPSQLVTHPAVSFIVAKPLRWYDDEYEMGDEFPQEAAKNIETLVRSRFLIPVVDDLSDKPKAFHREVQLREDVLDKLFREKTQIVFPTADVLTRSEESSEPEAEPDADVGAGEGEDTFPPAPSEVPPEVAAEAVHSDTFDPSYHTVTEVLEYLAVHPDEREAVVEKEKAGKNRKGIVEGY